METGPVFGKNGRVSTIDEFITELQKTEIDIGYTFPVYTNLLLKGKLINGAPHRHNLRSETIPEVNGSEQDVR